MQRTWLLAGKVGGPSARPYIPAGIYRESGLQQKYVEDTGEGIPAHHLDRLFERFYRVDRARSRELGGTGLGIAIVKHLARAHGGEVTVESRFGEGTQFTIELPGKNVRPEQSQVTAKAGD